MNGGSKFLASAAALALAGCGGSEAKLQIRSIPAPLSASAKPVPFRIAEAQQQLALGNVALALESYRKALRDQPDSVEAMLGIANSYDRMARFDVSRRYYESALAIVPTDTGVLNAFAQSLDLQGRADEAMAVRREIGVRLAAVKPLPRPGVQAASRPVAIAQPVPVAGPSVTVALPAPKPFVAAPIKARTTQARPSPTWQVAAGPAPAPTPIAIAAAKAPVTAVQGKPGPIATTSPSAPRQVVLAVGTVPVIATQPRRVRPTAAGPSTAPVSASAGTVTQPVPKQAAAVAMLPEAPRKPAPAALATVPSRVSASIAGPIKIVDRVAAATPPSPPLIAVARSAADAASPRPHAETHLERLSPSEVVLVTTGKPRWRSQVVGRTAQSTTIRYVPLRAAGVRMAQIRLLNAARHRGLAARTRSILASRGWRQLAIGDATGVRTTSLILYPPNRRSTAKRLAKQFGFPIEKRASGTELVMLIGQDATRIAGTRTGG